MLSPSSKYSNGVVIMQDGTVTTARPSSTYSASSHRSSADSGYGSSNGSSSSSGSDRYGTGAISGYCTNVRESNSRKGKNIVLINHRRSRSDDDSRFNRPWRRSCSSSGYGGSYGTGWLGRGSGSGGTQSMRGIPNSGGFNSPLGIQSRRDISSSGHEKEGAAAEQPLKNPEDNHSDVEAPGSTLPMEWLLDSGAEDDSNSSDGGNEDDEEADESDHEVAPQFRPDGQRTSSGSSSDASLVSPLLGFRRRHMVDRLMSEFRDLLNQTIGARGRASGEGSRSGSSSAGRGSRQNGLQGPHSNRNQGWSRNRSSSGNDETGEGGGNSGEASRPASTPNLPLCRKFACPYFKRDPRKHGKHRSCVGPGWSTVHRVKEHIYRQHQLPAFCTRCGTTFTQDAELIAHSRLALACDVRVFDPPDGFTKDQERVLRRKRKFAGSEETKWRAMYKVLFPDDDEADMPSPYHESGTGVTWESRRSQEFDNYERYLRRELPTLVRQQLEIAASEFSGPLENQLRGQLVEIVRDAQSQLFRRYRGADSVAGMASFSGMLPEFQSTADLQHESLSDNISGAEPLDFDFSAFYPLPLVDENHVNPMDVFTAPMSTALSGEHHTTSDSGYGSMGLPAETDCPGCCHTTSAAR